MQISLPPEMEQAVLAKVANGVYRDVNDVMHDAVSCFLLQDHYESLKLERLRAAVKVGIDELDRGELAEGDVMDLIAKRKKRRGALV